MPRARSSCHRAAADTGQQQHQRHAQADDDAELVDQRQASQRQQHRDHCQHQARAALPRRLCQQCGAHHRTEAVRVLRRQRHPHIAPAAQPEHQRGHEHQDAGNAERPSRAQILQRQRDQQRGEQRAEVDDPVEAVEHHLGQVLVGLVELVAHERGHQRLDAARTQRDQAQPEEEAAAAAFEQRQAGMPGAIHQAEPQNGVVFAEEAIGQPTAEQREEKHPDHEAVQDVLGLGLAAGSADLLQQQRGDQELHQDVAHPVEAETLAGFVADDEGYLARQPRTGSGARQGGSGQGQSGRAENTRYRTGGRRLAAIATMG